MLQSKEAHGAQLLSPCSTAWKPQLLSPRTPTMKTVCPRACAPQQEKPLQWEAPLSATREKPAQQQRPCTAKTQSTNK